MICQLVAVVDLVVLLQELVKLDQFHNLADRLAQEAAGPRFQGPMPAYLALIFIQVFHESEYAGTGKAYKAFHTVLRGRLCKF